MKRRQENDYSLLDIEDKAQADDYEKMLDENGDLPENLAIIIPNED